MRTMTINPDSKFSASWDLIVFISSLYVAITVPLSLVFPNLNPIITMIADSIVTIIFGLDILYNLNLSFQVEGKLVKDRKLIVNHYLRHWFLIDILAFIPFGLILKGLPLFQLGRIIKVLRVVRVLKLIRVIKTIQGEVSQRMNPAILRMIVLLFWFLMVAHFISCAWLAINPNVAGNNEGDKYLYAFYWTITTITTIGYGDITPQTRGQVLFVIIIEILGAAMYGLLIGNIANLIVNIDVAKNQFKERLERVNTFLKYRRIPHKVQRKINDYYQYLWETRRGYEETQVLNDLPEPLKMEVSLYLNMDIIKKVPLFKEASKEFIRDIIVNLLPVVYSPDDYIVKAGELGADMFFISKGSVQVLSPNEQMVYATLTQGQFFGEMALLLSVPRTATIKALEYCDLYRLPKDVFTQVLQRYPDFEQTILQLTKEREEANKMIKKKGKKT